MDDVGNVIICKPASSGKAHCRPLVLQGHMDMVPQANAGRRHDFTRDPITTRIEGEWVMADGTTLGADNGIGVAAMLAVLEADDLPHGPLEALFTCTEETGMDGAFGLQPGVLQAEILINTDSEEEGTLCIGCAGGANVDSQFLFQGERLEGDWSGFRLSVTGLKGGHSGVDNHRGRGNAIALLFRILQQGADQHGLRICAIDAGNMRNAIPREAFAELMVPFSQVDAFTDSVTRWQPLLAGELSEVEPGLIVGLEPRPEVASTWLGATTQEHLIHAIRACPHGVLRMSERMPDLVESSNNLAIVQTEESRILVRNLVRSSVDTARDDICGRLRSLFHLAEAATEVNGEYPGWQPEPDSKILALVQRSYQALFQKPAEVGAMHAGLECGIIGATYPGMEMISFGPTIRFPHSPDERVHIPSVKRFWLLLTRVLAEIGER